MAALVDCKFELAEAEMAARTKMKNHANYLIRQVEAIETLGKDCRTLIKDIESSRSLSEGDKIPEFLAVSSFDETPAIGKLEEENSLFLSSSETTANIMETPHRGSQAAALADDLSSCCTTPAAAEASKRVQQLEAENRRLRDALSRCCEAALRIQTNSDLKIVQLQNEVTHLNQQIADEQATNSRCMVLNQSLRKRLHKVATDIIQKKGDSQEDMERFMQFSDLHQREVIVEKHLNSLIISRNAAIKDNTALKKLLLGTCMECRQRLPLKRKVPQDKVDPQPAVAATKRPTYQTSARQVLENLPKQPAAPLSQTNHQREMRKQLALQNLPQSSLSKAPTKSCLKRSAPATDKPAKSFNDSSSSPTSTTEELISTSSSTLPACMPETSQSPQRKIPERNGGEDRNKGIKEGPGPGRLSFRRRLGEDKLQLSNDKRPDEISNARERNQAESRSMTPTSGKSPNRDNKSKKTRASPHRSSQTSVSTSSPDSKQPVTGKSKDNSRWRRRSGGGLLGDRSKRWELQSF